MMHPLEAELRDLVQNSILISFFEKAVDGMWMWDLTVDGSSWVTPAFARTFGYELNEIEQGAAFWKGICHPGDWDNAMTKVRQAVEANTVYDAVVRMRHKDGRCVWVRSVGIVLYDENESPHRCFGIQQNITELMAAKEAAERAQERAERKTKVDPLTELMNRRGLEETLLKNLSQAEREGSKVYAVILDLDDFKKVNEQYGHAYGDALLKSIARRFKNTLRLEDTVARIGGDEFCIVYSGKTREEALASLHRVGEALSYDFVVMDEVIPAQFSAALVRVSSPDIQSILMSVVESLHKAKNNGKGQIVHTPSDHPPPLEDTPKSYSSFRIHTYSDGHRLGQP